MANRRITLVVTKKFAEEIAALSKTDREALMSLLGKLQNDPYSVVEEAHASGEFFASRVLKDMYLYWSLDYPDNLSLTGSLTVKLLALKKVAERSHNLSIGKSK